MDEQIYTLTKKLKFALDNDERIIVLNNIEKEMNDNEEVMALAYRKDLASDEYNDLLKIYDENHPSVAAAKERLYLAKKRLDEHHLVKRYLEAFREVKLLLFEVNKILFDDFKGSC